MTHAPFYPDTIPVVFSSNNYFVPYMAAMMQSIMENAGTERRYAFFVLHRDITAETMKMLDTQIALFPQFSVDCIDVTPFIKGYSFFTANRADITAEAYFRLLIPEFFSDYTKVIYLDGDMICCADIAELYQIELGDNLLASTRDFLGISGYYKDKINHIQNNRSDVLAASNLDNYFISGMLFINITQFLKSFSTTQMLEIAVSRQWQFHDQDILNMLCEGKVLFLPITWDFAKEDNIKYLPCHLRDLQDEYYETMKHPKIIHFASSGKKPWVNPCRVPYEASFWKYATRTPFIDTIITRMESTELITAYSFEDLVFRNIKYRLGIGIKFILRCFWARLLRDWKLHE